MVDDFFKDRGRIRSYDEMQFSIELVRPCPRCGSIKIDEFETFHQTNNEELLVTACPSCGDTRKFTFVSMGNMHVGPWVPDSIYELGAGVSEVLTPEQFETELQRLVAFTIVDPASLAPAEWDGAWRLTLRAMIAANERLKFPDPPPFVKAEQERLQRRVEIFDANVQRIADLEGFKPPRGHFGREEYRAHEAWLARGRTGEGRFDVENLKEIEVRVTAAELTASRLVHFSAERAALVGVIFDEAEWIDCKLPGTNLREIHLRDATLLRCELWQADMTMAKLTRATLIECDLRATNQDRATWTGALVRGCKLTNALFVDARLDGSKFSGCEMRGARFATGAMPDLATTHGAVFEDCDLRESTWTGRDLSGVQFVRCKLDGATGLRNAIIDDE